MKKIVRMVSLAVLIAAVCVGTVAALPSKVTKSGVTLSIVGTTTSKSYASCYVPSSIPGVTLRLETLTTRYRWAGQKAAPVYEVTKAGSSGLNIASAQYTPPEGNEVVYAKATGSATGVTFYESVEIYP